MEQAVVVGGGAAGLMASGMLAAGGMKVVVVEPNVQLGKKLRITGKGRCNLTNFCDVPEMVRHIPTNGSFLYSAFSRFSGADTMRFFERLGVSLKVERGNRVFPQSDDARQVQLALEHWGKRSGAVFVTDRARHIFCTQGRVAGVKTQKGFYDASSVVLATGGLSYPLTGSTGDGYRIAEELGHEIVAPKPSLVALRTWELWPKQAQGLSLKNVELSVGLASQPFAKPIYSDRGEVLLTHFGISGPLTLSASAHLRPMEPGRYHAWIDLKPALSEQMLDHRLQREISCAPNREMLHWMRCILPSKLVLPVCTLSEISPKMKANQMTRSQRTRLAQMLKHMPLTIEGFRSVDEAIITSGGVSVKQVDPKTMESKLQKGLYFAGEILDADGYTGGFNLQIAWSTAVCAAQAILSRQGIDVRWEDGALL